MYECQKFLLSEFGFSGSTISHAPEVQKSQIDDEDSDIYDHKDYDENKFIEN